MPLEIKQLPKSEVEITGEVSSEEFSKFWEKAVKDASKSIKVPGFRPGKAPEQVLLDKIGDRAILDKAAEMALQDIYPRIIQEKKLEVIGHPQASITKISKGGPLGFKFQTAVLPEIKLPENYKEIAKKIADQKEIIVVEDKEVNDSLEYLRKSRKKKDLSAEALPDRQAGSAKAGEDVLPELNDEFAKNVGEFKTLEELKSTLKKNLQSEKEFKYKEKKKLEMLDAVLKSSEMEIPDVLISSEKNKMLYDLKANIEGMGMKWEDYLTHLKKKEEEILDGMNEDALRRVKYGLLLQHLSKIFKTEVSEKEIEDKIKELGLDKKEGVNPEGIEGIDSERIKDYAYGIIRNEKIFSFLEGVGGSV